MKKNILTFWIKFATIVLIPMFLTVVWFRKNLILAAGESGIPFYHIYTVAASVAHTWNEGLIGAAGGYSIGDFYFYKLLSIFESGGFSDVFLQALLFFTMILIGEFGVFQLVKRIFPKKHFVFYLSSIVFYTFNLVALVGVWNRLQYPFIVGYSFFPLILYLFIKGLDEKKLWYTVIINFILLLSSVAFTSVPLLELLWTALLLYIIFYVTIHFSKKKKILFSIYFVVFLGIEWILFNSWWLIQFIQGLFASSYTSQLAYGESGDISTFTTLSQHLGNIAYVVRLMHKDFFSSVGSLWNYSYQSVWMNILTFIIPFLAFFPLLLKNKSKYIYFFLGFALVAIYLSKGDAEPFGWLFLFLFIHLRFLEALRNPFEKFSLLLPLAYSPLIGYSIYAISQIIQKKWGRIISISAASFFILATIIVSYPLINSWVFTSTVQPENNKNIGYSVQVPDYYITANNWLNSDRASFRVIALPIDGEGITYKWNYGYSGVESSNGLFDKFFISFTPSLEFLGNISSQLQYSLYTAPGNFSQIMSLLNSKYIMVRSDIDYKAREMENPKDVNSYLSTASATIIPLLAKSKTFGKLQFYKNTQAAQNVYVSNSYNIANSQTLYSDIFSLTNFKFGDIILNSDNLQMVNKFLGSSDSLLIGANTVLTLNQSSFPIVTKDDASRQLFYPRTLPSSIFYTLVRLKEDLQSYSNTDPDAQFFTDVLLTNKRLGEFIAEVNLGSQKYAQTSFADYNKSIQLLNEYNNSTVLKNNIYYVRTQLLSEKINLESVISKNPQNFFKDLVNNALVSLDTFSLTNGIEPRFAPQTASGEKTTDKVVYDFSVPFNGVYDVVVKTDRSEFNSSNITTLQVDKNLQNSIINQNGDWVTIGKINLQKGIHEIQIPTQNPQNLLENETNYSATISSTPTDNIIKTIPLQNIYPFGTYRVTFDFWFSKGSNARVGIGSNIEDKNSLGSYKDLGADGYDNDFQTRSFDFTINPDGRNYYLAFKVFPYNNCESINSQNPFAVSECRSNAGFYNLFGKPTILQIKNLKVERIFTTDQAFLRQIIPQKKKNLPKISVEKINSSEYSVTIKNATDPYFLVLSQSFNSLWTAKITNNNQILSDHILVNSYANGWYISKSGNYTIDIEFSPEKYLIIGKMISAIALIGSVFTLVIIWTKKKL